MTEHPLESVSIPLVDPADGLPEVVTSERGVDEAARAIAGGVGPVTVDAERASGHRYGQRAYLVQLRREGSRTWLIDPIAVPDLSPINEAIGGLSGRGGPAPAAVVRHRAGLAPGRAPPGRVGCRR